MLWQNIRTAFEALVGNRLRSALTLLGVVIGVFAVVTTVSMGEIATAGITSEIQAFGAQTLFITQASDNPDATPFSDDDLTALSRLPIDILATLNVNGRARVGDREVGLRLDGTGANAVEIDRTLSIAQGRYFSESEYSQAAPVIVLSADAAEELFPTTPDPVGNEVAVTVVGSRTFYTVIGVAARPDTAFGGFPEDISGNIPLETLYLNYANLPAISRGEFPFLQVSIALGADAAEVEQQVRAILDRRRGADTYNVQSIEGALELFNTITVILQAVLGGIGSISLLVGGIGILNIMLVSVTERTREIGLRKALGAKKATILQQFLIEAVVLTVTGGLFGLLLAVGTLHLIVAVVPFLDQVVINPFTIILAVTVSIVTGVVFGVWPANRAANLSPIEALRYE